MFDVNQITTTLRGLPDRILQQYAMMNKGNPYILSLAVAESNQRKQLRTAAQARNAMPQPKVADAAIASMTEAPAVDAMGNVTGMAAGGLPEDYGIGRLPARNIERMADGGIAGYGDGDDVPRKNGMAQGGMYDFAQRSEPVVRMSGGGEVPRYQFGGALSGDFSGFGGVTPEQEAKAEIQAAEQERVKKIIALEQKVAFLKSAGAPQAQEAQMQLDALKADTRPKPSPTDPNFRRQTDPRMTGTAATLPPTPTPPDAKPTAGGGVKDLLPDSPKLDTSYKPVAAPTAAEAKSKASELYDSKGQIRSLEGKQAQARQDIFSQRDERLAQLEAFNKEQGPAFANYEKMLKKEELQDVTDKEKAGLTSLMKGFLAMAAGESPNAATNIAKGAMVGLGDYGDAVKEFKKAAKERTKAMADIENARRAEAKGDFKDQQAFTDRANERLAASDDRFTGLISQITGKEADVAASLFNNMNNNAEETSRMMFKERGLTARAAMSENRADLRSQTPDKRVFDALVTQYGDPVKAAEALQKMKAEKFNLYEAYNKYLTAFAGKDTLTPPMAFDLFAKQFIPEVNPNKNTTIRTQPGG
jgi:hypothetical protein